MEGHSAQGPPPSLDDESATTSNQPTPVQHQSSALAMALDSQHHPAHPHYHEHSSGSTSMHQLYHHPVGLPSVMVNPPSYRPLAPQATQRTQPLPNTTTSTSSSMAIGPPRCSSDMSPLLSSLNSTANSGSTGHNNNNNSNVLMGGHSYSRSSPIAIIHNPEDGEGQAKLRIEHPMYYDTSDDEFDECGSNAGGGMSSESSPFRPAQSLPTALLRAPKLGSLPSSHEYLLRQHNLTLPPPMSLDGITISADGGNHNNNYKDDGTIAPPSQQRVRKPMSSYGSLRESHLTGRFGATAPAAGRRVRFHGDGQPTALLPPQVDSFANNNTRQLLPPQASLPPRQQQQQQMGQRPLSIRDRMMLKAQLQKEEQQRDEKPTSSLSAMLEASNPTTPQSGPASAAFFAVQELPPFSASAAAFSSSSSYNHNNEYQQPEPAARITNNNYHTTTTNESVLEDAPSSTNNNATTGITLSTSMTGLSVLLAASKTRTATTNRVASSLYRPASLGSAAALSTSSQGPPPAQPPTATNPGISNKTLSGFTLLARSLSDPTPQLHYGQQPQVGVALPQFGTAAAAPPPFATEPPPQQLPFRGFLHPATHRHAPTPPLAFNLPADAQAPMALERDDGHNPDTEGAFDMDLE